MNTFPFTAAALLVRQLYCSSLLGLLYLLFSSDSFIITGNLLVMLKQTIRIPGENECSEIRTGFW